MPTSDNERPADHRDGQASTPKDPVSTGNAAARHPQGSKAPARRPQKPGRSRRPARRSRAPLFAWGSVVVVVVVVVALLVANMASPKHQSTVFAPTPVPASILQEVTHIPPSVYNAVGTGSRANVQPPRNETGQAPLHFGTKPGLLYVGGEFCPYCAAERWALIAALSRFGSLSDLETMQSSPVDVYPSTPTFSFAKASYSSKYLSARLVEYYGQDRPTGSHPVVGHLTRAERAAIAAAEGTGSAASPHAGVSIPFVDVANRQVQAGASYSPQLLAGLSRAQIARDLSHPANPVAQAVVGTSNYFSAAICAADGQQPAAVCTSSGVVAAAQAAGIGS